MAPMETTVIERWSLEFIVDYPFDKLFLTVCNLNYFNFGAPYGAPILFLRLNPLVPFFNKPGDMREISQRCEHLLLDGNVLRTRLRQLRFGT